MTNRTELCRQESTVTSFFFDRIFIFLANNGKWSAMDYISVALVCFATRPASSIDYTQMFSFALVFNDAIHDILFWISLEPVSIALLGAEWELPDEDTGAVSGSEVSVSYLTDAVLCTSFSVTTKVWNVCSLKLMIIKGLSVIGIKLLYVFVAAMSVSLNQDVANDG